MGVYGGTGGLWGPMGACRRAEGSMGVYGAVW